MPSFTPDDGITLRRRRLEGNEIRDRMELGRYRYKCPSWTYCRAVPGMKMAGRFGSAGEERESGRGGRFLGCLSWGGGRRRGRREGRGSGLHEVSGHQPAQRDGGLAGG